ncbi:MAG: hypothetical protein QM473_18895 [Acidobacteriota bacterium]|jgi:hypothetical protein|nr:hypothetical protein [Acidobacteriota bacterium]
MLGPKQHRAWTLHLAGKSNDEIAEATEAKVTAVVQLLCVVRKKLRKWLHEDQAARSDATQGAGIGAGSQDADGKPDDTELHTVPFALGPGPGGYA